MSEFFQESFIMDDILVLIIIKLDHVVLVKSCRQSKDADSKFALEKDAKGNLQPTIYVYEQD